MKQPKRKTLKQKMAESEAQTTTMEDRALSFESPESSSIVRAVYDPDTLTLLITFVRPAGQTITYRYTPFRFEAWVEFEMATSKGAHFNRCIQPFYLGVACD